MAAGSKPSERDILKVRHSFAHGFGMPSFGWNTNGSTARLTNRIVQREVVALFNNLVKRTDRGLKHHLEGAGIGVPW